MQNIFPSYSPFYCILSIRLTSNHDSVYPHGAGTTLSPLILGLSLAPLFLLLSLLLSVFTTSTVTTVFTHGRCMNRDLKSVQSMRTTTCVNPVIPGTVTATPPFPRQQPPNRILLHIFVGGTVGAEY